MSDYTKSKGFSEICPELLKTCIAGRLLPLPSFCRNCLLPVVTIIKEECQT